MTRRNDVVLLSDLEEEPGSGALGLLAFLAIIAACGYVLWRSVGLPHLPAVLPDGSEILRTLRGSELPLPAVIYLLGMVGWGLWLWVISTLVLRLLLAVADVLTRGAQWVRSLRALSDRITFPAIRRLADGAIIAVTVVHLAGRTVPMAVAAPLESGPTKVLTEQAGSAVMDDTWASKQVQAEGTVTYQVQPGDTLYEIAARFYGDGEVWPKILEANVGRPMSHGETFERSGVIQPGWRLLILNPTAQTSPALTPEPAQKATYIVQEGDTLRYIATRTYGDETTWLRIYDASRGAHLPDGRTLNNPDIIWPGLPLVIPGEARGALPTAAPASVPPAPSPAITSTPAVSSPASIPSTPPPHAYPAEEHNERLQEFPVPAPAAEVVSPAPPLAMPSTTGEQQTSLPARRASTPEQQPVARPHTPASRFVVQPSQLAAGVAGLASLGLAGAAVVVGRRHVRRQLEEPSLPGEGGFANSELARTVYYRLRGTEVEPVVSVAGHVLRLLEDRGLDGVAVLSASQGKQHTTLTMRAGLAERQQLLQMADDLGTRLGGTAQASLTSEHDVVLRFSHLKAVNLLVAKRSAPASLALLPLGMLRSGETVYGNWHELGQTLVAGMPGGGMDVLLTTLLGGLAAAYSPPTLSIWTVAAPHTFPNLLYDLPHQVEQRIDPTDTAAVTSVLEKLRSALERRIAGEAAREPELVLVIGDLAAVTEHASDLLRLTREGAPYGIHVLAAVARVQDLDGDLVDSYQTRLVLRTRDEQLSIRLLGRPDAAHLDAGGAVLARIAGRGPVELRGFRISPETLRDLVELMQEGCGVSPPGTATEEQHVPAPSVPPDRASTTVASHAGMPEEASLPVDVVAPTTVSAMGVAEQTPARAAHAPDQTRDRHEVTAAEHVLDAPVPEVVPQEPVTDVVTSSLTARIDVCCFGGFRVRHGDRTLTSRDKGGIERNQEWEALAYLATHEEGKVTKEQICAALWPDVEFTRALRSLHATLNRLRSVLAEQVPGVSFTGAIGVSRQGCCRLDPAIICSDVHEFLSLVQQSRDKGRMEVIQTCERARALYTGELLQGVEYPWLDERDTGATLREMYRETYHRLLHRLGRLYLQEGVIDRAVGVYETLLDEVPTLEDVAQQLYRCYQRLGDRTRLVWQHQRLQQALRDAYGDSDEGEGEIVSAACALDPQTVAVYEEVLADLKRRAGEVAA